MTKPTFIDLDINIFSAGPDAYKVTAQVPGGPLYESTLDWVTLASDDFVEQLRQIREEPFSTDQSIFQAVGTALFAALFRNQVRDVFVSTFSQRVQPDANAYLRLRLNISEDAPQVALLPWEFVFDNERFLATYVRILVTRQLLNANYGPIQPLTVLGKPRALVVVPRGSDLATSDEVDRISNALSAADIPFDVLPDPKADPAQKRVSLTALYEKLGSTEYHILHFIGHGQFKEQADGKMHGALRFNANYDETNEKDDVEWVEDTRLLKTLHNVTTLRLVVLNACEGAVVAQNESGRGFIGVAPAIMRAGVPAVVAMQYQIRDDVAVIVAKTFYGKLTEGKWCGQVDTCLTEARDVAYLYDPKDRGFATPVLYLRSPDGVIFQCTEPPPPPPPSRSRSQPQRQQMAPAPSRSSPTPTHCCDSGVTTMTA